MDILSPFLEGLGLGLVVWVTATGVRMSMSLISKILNSD